MGTENRASEHYTRGSLLEDIEAALNAAGTDTGHVDVATLGAIDEFHVGGREATDHLAGKLAFEPGQRVLDIGCGLGGPARHLAESHGVRVRGIDATEEFVSVGNAMSGWTALAERVELVHGDALALPFADASFDRAVMLHVGMNIEDKRTLFAEVARVLGPRGIFGIYDIVRVGEGELDYPLPWAGTPEFSFVEPLDVYERHLESGGFAIDSHESRAAFARAFFGRQKARVDAGEPRPVLGLHVTIGAEAPVRLGNLAAHIAAGTLAPVEIVAVRR